MCRSAGVEPREGILAVTIETWWGAPRSKVGPVDAAVSVAEVVAVVLGVVGFVGHVGQADARRKDFLKQLAIKVKGEEEKLVTESRTVVFAKDPVEGIAEKVKIVSEVLVHLVQTTMGLGSVVEGRQVTRLGLPA